MRALRDPGGYPKRAFFCPEKVRAFFHPAAFMHPFLRQKDIQVHKKSGFLTRLILQGLSLPLALPHHEQPQAMDCALEELSDETCDLPLH
jgi:hypothetical protein